MQPVEQIENEDNKRRSLKGIKKRITVDNKGGNKDINLQRYTKKINLPLDCSLNADSAGYFSRLNLVINVWEKKLLYDNQSHEFTYVNCLPKSSSGFFFTPLLQTE